MTAARARSLLAWALCAVCALRVLDFVAHEPLLAYGNNYDQVRYTGCVGVFPHRPGVDPGLYSPEGPQVRFSRQPEVDAPCVATSEIVFLAPFAGWLALEPALGGDGVASVRAAGIARALVFLAVLAAAILALQRRARLAAATGLAAAAALVLADPAILLWANTFYAEYASVIALLACVALLIVAWLDGGEVRLLGPWTGVAMAIAAFALALGKVQFGALPLALVLGYGLAALARPREARRYTLLRVAPFALGAVAGFAVQLATLARTDDPALPLWHRVGTFNAVFNGLLASSDDPARTATRIGLPARCAGLAGRTIFDYAERAQWESACPEVFALRRAPALLALATSEPGTLMRLLARAARGLDPWVQRELGHVADERYGDVTQERSSFGPLLERAGHGALIVLLAPLAWLVVALGFHHLRRCDALAWLGAWLANAVIWQQLVLTAIGDGVHDVSRQAFLAYAAALAWIVACVIGALARRMFRGVPDPPRVPDPALRV